MTESNISKLQPPSSGFALYWDDSAPGFGVRITSNGVISFVLQRRFNGKDRRITLGRFGVFSVAEARDKAKMVVADCDRHSNHLPTLKGVSKTIFDIDSFDGNVLRIVEDGVFVNFCKKGNMSWKRAYFFENPVTPLMACDVCGRLGTQKMVRYRIDVSGWNGDFLTNPDKNTLCMSCWNKIRPIVKQENEAKEIKTLTNKLNRSVKEWRKSQRLAS